MTNRKLSLLAAALLCMNVALPATAAAQQKTEKEQVEDFGKDVLGALFGPNWNVFVQGGFTTNGRFLLQHPAGGGLGEQSVETNTGYNISVGGGFDYILRQGFRIYYVYSNNDLTYRTNNGDGSSALDVDPHAKIHSNTIAAELVRYMLPARSVLTPYGTLGLTGTWWGLDSSPLVLAPGGSTQFRMGASLAFGLQVRAWESFGARLEASSYTTGNPFTGKNSFRTTAANIIDEPTSVGRWDYRLGGVYYFQKRSAVVAKKP